MGQNWVIFHSLIFCSFLTSFPVTGFPASDIFHSPFREYDSVDPIAIGIFLKKYGLAAYKKKPLRCYCRIFCQPKAQSFGS